jgi:hypothetical protein
MREIMESIFDIAYLLFVVAIGIYLIVKGHQKKDKETFLYGIMAVTLGGGDAFHLVPRIMGLLQYGDTAMYTAFAFPLGLGKLITSITMTIFYLLLYYVYRLHFGIKDEKWATISMYVFALARVILCCFPENEWFIYPSRLDWAIYRNIPFALMGILVIILFAKEAIKKKDKIYIWMPLAIFLSFGFYLPVVIWGETYPMIGLLMIPKTLAYVAVVVMGYLNYRKKGKENEKA